MKSKMKLMKMAIAVVLGTVAVVWIFCTFIMRVNVVEMTSSDDGTVVLKVDDGRTFTDSDSCVQHCLSRNEWNLQNSVRVKTFGNVGSNEAIRLGDLFLFNHIYPTDDRWQANGPKGRTYFRYHPGPYCYQLAMQGRHLTNDIANQVLQAGGAAAPRPER